MILPLRYNLRSMASRVEPLTKQKIRSKMLYQLKKHKEEDRKRKSRIIGKKLFRTLIFEKAKIVMFYLSFDGEVETEEMIIAAKKLGKIVAVPVCVHNRIIIRACLLEHKAKLEKGPYGICVPAVKNFINQQDLDLIIVPGLAFDKEGHRLGRGRGCYDRFLATLTGNKNSIGLAFDFQILPSVPVTKTDIQVSQVIFA